MQKYLLNIYGVIEKEKGSKTFIPFSRMTTIDVEPTEEKIEKIVTKTKRQNPLIQIVAARNVTNDPPVLEFIESLDE